MPWEVQVGNGVNILVAGKLKSQLEQYERNEAVLEDMFYRNLEFGTVGIRGEIGPGTNRMTFKRFVKRLRGWRFI